MTSQPTPQGVNLLKELLFDRESKRLDVLTLRLETEAAAVAERHKTLNERLDAVFERAGTEERLLHSVAVIIDGALREAEVTRHEPLSRAIAPLIVQTIKVQLRDSQDEMVDALYPITGRLIKSYVQAEVNKRMIEINAKLGGGRPKALAAKSAATGISAGDLALAEANKLQVEEVFLVRRGSGELIAHWEKSEPDAIAPAASRPGGSNRDVLISGYISGIMTFSEEAFGATPGSFRTIELENGERIFVRGSAAHLLAVRCHGSAGAPVEQVIDEVFLDTLERYQQVLITDTQRRRADGVTAGSAESQAKTRAEIAAILPAVGTAIERKTAERQLATANESATVVAPTLSFARLYTLAAALAAPFVVWGLWSAYQNFETLRTESAANRVLETTDEIKGMPPKIEVARGGRALTLSGFVPSAALRDQILMRLNQEVPQAKIRNQLDVLPQGTGALEAAFAQWRSASDLQRQEAASAAVARSLSRIRRRLEPLRISVARQVQAAEAAGARSTLIDLRAALDTALEKLELSVGAAAIDQNQLQALWLALTRADDLLASAMGAPAPHQGAADMRPSGRQELAEEAGLLAERLSTVGLGLSIPADVTALAAQVARLRPLTPLQELDNVVRSSALFFENGADLRDAKLATATLDDLATHLRNTPGVLLRVVGYTDERGGQALNSNLAQTRADRVAALLIERGVPSNRLVAVGRLIAKDISRTVGAGSANRRVEFEIGFPGETDEAR